MRPLQGRSLQVGREYQLFLSQATSVNPPRLYRYETFWQHSDNASPNPGDADIFNGDAAGLQRYQNLSLYIQSILV